MTSWNDLNTGFTGSRAVLTGLIGLASFFSIKSIISYFNKEREIEKLNSQRTQAKSDIERKIEKFLALYRNKVSSHLQFKILEADLTTLHSMIRTKKVSCEEVFITYAVRAGTIGFELNLISDLDFENGLREAQSADLAIREGRTLGPLHGIPVATYGALSIKNYFTSFNPLIYNNTAQDSLVVSVLRKQGAIPFLKTNSLQSLLAFGYPKNPWNKNKTSLGGESALVTARCSPFSIGLDVLGSLRLQCAFTGAYCLKTTSTRQGGLPAFLWSLPVLNGSYGPVCKSMEDLLFVSKSLIGHYEKDLYINNSPFDEEILTKVIDNNNIPTKIGFFREIRNFPTAPGIKDSLDNLMHFLKTAGYHLIEFPLDRFEEFIQTGIALMLNSDLTTSVEKDEYGLYQENLDYLNNTSDFSARTFQAYKARFTSKDIHLVDKLKSMSRHEYIETNIKFNKLKHIFIEYWQEHHFDAIISPCFPSLALEKDEMKNFVHFNHMAYLFNWADLPSVVVPLQLNYNTLYTDTYDDNFSKILKRNIQTSNNLPITIQIGTLPNHDEWALRLAKEIDYFFRFDKICDKEIFKKFPVPNYVPLPEPKPKHVHIGPTSKLHKLLEDEPHDSTIYVKTVHVEKDKNHLKYEKHEERKHLEKHTTR